MEFALDSGLQQLLETVESAHSSGRSPWIQAVAAKRQEDSIVVHLQLVETMSSHEEEWEIICLRPVAQRMLFDECYDLELSFEHVIAREHVDPHQDLYFRGRPHDPAGAAMSLYARHIVLAEMWIPFGRYLN